MKVGEIYKKAKKPVFSIEMSPPLNGGSQDPIFNTIEAYKEFKPAWCSITCGALGRPRGGTISLCGRIKRESDIETVAHFISMGRSKQDVENLLMDMQYEEIQNVLALRGDPPAGDTKFRPHPKGHRYACELVKQIQDTNQGKYLAEKEGEYREGLPADFCISVAGHPEGHPECTDKKKGLSHLKIKVEEGVDYITTQLFFNPEHYLNFVENARKIGIQIPFVPGVMPIVNLAQLNFIINQNLGIEIPKDFMNKLQKYHDKGDKASAQKYGTEYITKMCQTLLDEGAPGIHLYTMNSPTRGRGIIESLYKEYFADLARPELTYGEFIQVELQLGTLMSEANEMRDTIGKIESGELQEKLEKIDEEYNQIKTRLEVTVDMRKKKEIAEIEETIRKVQSGEMQKRLEEIEQEHNQIETRLEQAVDQTPTEITHSEFLEVELQLGTLLYEADELRVTIKKVQSGEMQKRLELIDQKYKKIMKRQEEAIEMHKNKEAEEIRETIGKAQSGEMQRRLEKIEQEHKQIEARLEQAIERLSKVK
ncbi:MAG: methylenetetrahydrofolate reductase [Dehalococcoidia bacterium]|nr:MAG: methylenetetrahydrofolate reductase [Dehalococcoidia bacterium]